MPTTLSAALDFPDTGRYLSPEPMLLRPGFALSMARAGMQAPSYAYANNNPVKFTDSSGLYINVSTAILAPTYGDISMCPPGSDACTVPRYSYLIGPCRPMTSSESSARSCPASRRYKFDVDFGLTLQVHFRSEASAAMDARDGSWSLRAHEQLHVNDLSQSLSESALNGAIDTEGFPTLAECRRQRSNFEFFIMLMAGQASGDTQIRRDCAGSSTCP